MNKLFLAPLLMLTMTFSLFAENKDLNKTTPNSEQNKSIKSDSNKTKSKSKIMEKEVKEQMEREKEYAQKQSFAQGDDYDLSAHEVNENSLPDVPVIEPDYDFDITDVYRDDL